MASTETTQSKPLVATALWEVVMEAAGWTCQCAGSCGSKHSVTARQCDAKHHGTTRLTAAPADLGLPPAQAAVLPASELRAWCPPCYRAGRKQAAAHDAERRRLEQHADALFNL
jgi:hypothetical protein